ncbi:hypothetical protein BGC33_14760 [Bathymodiolus thermophilus thioautotrophic gill symbiont]|nr:hypothetical protein BGC33_14760 [Bathymodiolus thermophilus thioautotrophic gill symbiont]
MFEKFFDTPGKYQYRYKDCCRDIDLIEQQQNQEHTIVFDVEKKIECFDLKPLVSNIKNVKVCDYVLINHTDKKILFCELKNAKDKSDAIKQLRHSKNIVDCLINILDSNISYKRGYVVINKKSLNKGNTRKKWKLISGKHFKYIYTGRTSINFDKLNYE